ncbi:MAG: ABC transporter permease [Alphaproteobacteria bacterium]
MSAEQAVPGAKPAQDERIHRQSMIARTLSRPELGAISGAVIVLLFFALYGNPAMFQPQGIVNWLDVCAQLGIIAIGACLLMIGGEFDLSLGSMIGFSSAILAILIVEADLPVWMALVITVIMSMAIGFSIGVIVVATKLPSFIVTLGFLFLLRGLMLVSMRTFHGDTQVEGMAALKQTDFVAAMFGGELFSFTGTNVRGNNVIEITINVPMSVLWWVVLGLLATWVLARTRAGNWIYASGGNAASARSVGVPVAGVKIALFMVTALCATIFGAIQAFDGGSVDGARGNLKELEAIAAAVVGGTLLTGGYGSVVGACIGALIFGVVAQGFFYTNIDSDWYRVFVGGILLVAVGFNTFIRRRATGGL